MTTSTAAPGLVHLIERNPEVSGAEMVASLTPPPQFHNATFDTYRADAAYPQIMTVPRACAARITRMTAVP